MPREWDARAYDSLPLPHERWGRRTVARLKLNGDERVLEAGCGTGRDTEHLLRLLPRGRVIAVDGSRRMLDQLRARLDGRLARVEVVHADLTEPLPIEEKVDAVTSVAAFHWITDHDALFRNLAAVLRPGGRLVAECGGRGNISVVNTAIDAAIREIGGGDLAVPPKVWNFADAAETERRLRAAGFVDIEVELVPDAARLQAGEQLRTYLAAVVLGGHLAKLPEDRHEAFVQRVAERLPEPVIDYVRLNIAATRAR
jgi:trans-aconitate 2-methyltransferase